MGTPNVIPGRREERKSLVFLNPVIAAFAATIFSLTTPSMAQESKQNSGKPVEVASVSVKKHEISPEEQRLLEEAGKKTMEFLNKNAPAHAKNHQVLVVTTMGAMEWVSNGKDLDSFFRQLEKSLDEKTLNLAIFKLFQKYAPGFLEHISVNSFPNVYKNLAILYENEQLDKELVELRERGEKWKVIGDFITALEKQKKGI